MIRRKIRVPTYDECHRLKQDQSRLGIYLRAVTHAFDWRLLQMEPDVLVIRMDPDMDEMRAHHPNIKLFQRATKLTGEHTFMCEGGYPGPITLCETGLHAHFPDCEYRTILARPSTELDLDIPFIKI